MTNTKLTEVLQSGITEAEIENLYNFMRKETQVKKICDLDKIKYREATKQYYIYINRKQFTGATREELICSIYDTFFGIQSSSMNDIFTDYMIYRRDKTKTSAKTLKEHISLWNNHIKGTNIATMKIKDIKPATLSDYFVQLTKAKKLTERRCKDIKDVISCILKYAIQKEIISSNPAEYIDTSNCIFKQVNTKRKRQAKIIKTDARAKIIKYLESMQSDNIYDLAIEFAFHSTLRIGEIKAIKWSDIDYENRCVWIDKQIVETQVMNDDLTFNERTHVEVDHVKGNTQKGMRDIFLPDSSIRILERIKNMHIDNEYVFIFEGKFLSTVTFNRHLADICATLGINMHSSHDIRFSGASVLFHATKDEKQVQEALGHTTLTMTRHYIEDVIDYDERKCNYIQALG